MATVATHRGAAALAYRRGFAAGRLPSAEAVVDGRIVELHEDIKVEGAAVAGVVLAEHSARKVDGIAPHLGEHVEVVECAQHLTHVHAAMHLDSAPSEDNQHL